MASDQESNPGFTRYMNSIQKRPKISREEERVLIAQAQAGDLKARDKLVETWLPYAAKMAYRYRSLGKTPIEDLVQTASEGLIHAVSKFDLKTTTTRFITYAAFWIRAYVGRSAKRDASLVRYINGDMEELLFTWLPRILRANPNMTLPEDIIVEVHKKTGHIVKAETVMKMQALLRGGDVSLNNPAYAGNTHNQISKQDILTDRSPSPEDLAIVNSENRELYEAINVCLDEREKDIVVSHQLKGEILRDIGTRLNLVTERVRQIEVIALAKLKEYLES